MKRENVKEYQREKEYEKLEDAEIMRIIHENARKHKNDKSIKKRNYVLEIAVYLSQVGVWVVLGMAIGYLWIK